MADNPDKWALAKVRAARESGDVDYLLGCLKSSDVRVRSTAARYLGVLQVEEAVPPLAVLYQREAPPEKVLLAKALARIGDARAMSVLHDAAVGNAPIGVRTSAMAALVKLGDRRAGPLIARLLVDPTLGDQVRNSPMRPRGSARYMRRWARRTLIDSKAVEALGILAEGLPSITGVQRVRLRRVIRHLRRAQG